MEQDRIRLVIYTAFALCLLFTGCANTEATIKIKGKVTDERTKEPIPRRVIIVKGLAVSNNITVSMEAGSFSTDSSGSFTYSLRKVKDAGYYNFCLVGDSDYSYMAEKIALTYLERNAKHLSFSLNKLADLTIFISRESKKPDCDTLYLSWRSDGVDGRTLYPYKVKNAGLSTSTGLKWIGGNVKSTIKTRTFADQRTTVKWELFRNGKRREIIDTITCKRDLVNNVYLKY